MDYRRLQVALDLRRAALFLEKEAAKRFRTHRLELKKKLEIGNDRIPAEWRLELSPQEFADCVEWSCTPEQGLETSLYATCIILLDRLEYSSRGSDFEWEWNAFASIYRSASGPVRSAIMNGLRYGREAGQLHETVVPSNHDCQTVQIDTVTSKLVEIARKITTEEARIISRADYGDDQKTHYDSLIRLLECEECLYPSGDSWFPAEVVELTSHVPNAIGFLSCTAIVLLNAIADNDACDNASFRWERNYHSYRQLEAGDWQALSAGFRHLHEVDTFWSVFDGRRAIFRAPNDAFLPWPRPTGR